MKLSLNVHLMVKTVGVHQDVILPSSITINAMKNVMFLNAILTVFITKWTEYSHLTATADVLNHAYGLILIMKYATGLVTMINATMMARIVTVMKQKNAYERA